MYYQLPLAINFPERPVFADFVAGDNALALDVCQSLCATNQDNLEYNQLYLWGAIGCGKTHLILACIDQITKQQRDFLYVPLQQIDELEPSMLEGNPSMLAVDDLQQLAHREDWQIALFSALNRARDNGTRVILTASNRPDALNIELADLRSRLNWNTVIQLKQLNLDQKRTWLQQHAMRQGYYLDDNSLNFILNYSSRDMHSLRTTLKLIDEGSLVYKSKVNMRLLRRLLSNT